MPHLIRQSSDLILEGPIIEVTVVPPRQVIELLIKEGKPVVTTKAIALIDTGASCTCIDNTVARSIGLVSHDIKRVLTASGEDMQCLYDAGILLPTMSTYAFSVQVLEAKLAKQPYKVLLGRDVLRHCSLIYHGWNHTYTLHL